MVAEEVRREVIRYDACAASRRALYACLMLRYLKAAFLARPTIAGLGEVPVNLLAVAGVAILGFGCPGFWFLGLVLEAAFVFGLPSQPRFQQWVDAQEAKQQRQSSASGADDAVRRLLAALPGNQTTRFENLRARCLELRAIA